MENVTNDRFDLQKKSVDEIGKYNMLMVRDYSSVREVHARNAMFKV